MRRQIIETFELAVPPEVAARRVAEGLRDQALVCRPRSGGAFAVAPARRAGPADAVVCEVRAAGEGASLAVLVDAAQEAARVRAEVTVLALVVGTTFFLALPVFGSFAVTVALPVMVGFAALAMRALSAARAPEVRRHRRALASAVGRALAPVLRPGDPYRGEVEATRGEGPAGLRVALPPAQAVRRAGELLATRGRGPSRLRFHGHFDPCCFRVTREGSGQDIEALVIASPDEGGSRLEVLQPADDLVLRAGLATAPIVAALALVCGSFALHFVAPIWTALHVGWTWRRRRGEGEREAGRAEIVAALQQGLAAEGRGAP